MAITLADLKFFGSERMTDNEDGGGNTRGGGNVMTEKYPSDNDE